MFEDEGQVITLGSLEFFEVGWGIGSCKWICKTRREYKVWVRVFGIAVYSSGGRVFKVCEKWTPCIQLGRSSSSAGTNRSKHTTSYAYKIIDLELELVQLQPNVEIEGRKDS